MCLFFFFQAEDGIRDATVTGVQTCALPIYCGGGGGTTVYSDNFETATGWTTNPAGTDTAVTGQWERGDPEPTDSGGAKQLGTTVSGTTVLLSQLGAAANRNGAWATGTANLSGFAGQTIRILIEAADAADPSLVEAGVDDVVITRL